MPECEATTSLRRYLPVCTALAGLAGAVSILAILRYTISNQSGHTGVNPYNALFIFIPVSLGGILHYFICPRLKWLGVIVIIIGIAGIAFLIYLDKTNTLLPYEEWVHRVMQGRG